MFVKLSRSTKADKKMTAIFYDNDRKKVKTIHFGQKNAGDFIIYSRTKGKKFAMERKRLYLQRHKKEVGGMMTASTLSKMILWNKPTLEASYQAYKKRYNLTKY